MPGNYYDAVLLGGGLSPIIAAGLLAKRGFRVLLLGQGAPAPVYTLGELQLPRSPFVLAGHDSPVIQRVFSELALKPLLRRRLTPLIHAFQIAMPGHRLSFGPDHERVAREIDREFPSIRRSTDDFFKAVDSAWSELNLLFEKDLVWPPTGFFERRAFTRAAGHEPFGKGQIGAGPLDDLPSSHVFRHMVSAVTRLSDGSQLGEGNPRRQLRLFGSMLRAADLTEGGLPGLTELLLDSIRTHSGQVRLDAHAERILVKRGEISGVRLGVSGEEVGAHFVLAGVPADQLMRLIDDKPTFDAYLEECGRPRAKLYRYTVNFVVRAEAVPEGMGNHVIVLRDPDTPLRDDGLLRLELRAPDALGRRVLCAEALLPAKSVQGQERGKLVAMRERVLAALEQVTPFLRPHVLWMDSPHDGGNIQDVQTGAESAPPDPWQRGPHTMPAVYAYERTSLHGSCALSGPTPIRQLLMCNDQVVPGLGLEGEFLSAWSAARIVTRALGRQWMRRGRWTKVEL